MSLFQSFQSQRFLIAARILLFVLLLTLTSEGLIAQNYSVKLKHWAVAEGLSHREVNSICQDKRGFIWLGTKFGLNRFDGQQFHWYTRDAGNLLFDDIQRVTQDSEGWMWLFNSFENPSLCFLDPESGHVLTPAQRFKNQPLPFDLQELLNMSKSEYNENIIFSLKNQGNFVYWNPKTGWHKVISKYPDFKAEHITSRNTVLGNSYKTKSTFAEVDLQGNVIRKEDFNEFVTIHHSGTEKEFVLVRHDSRKIARIDATGKLTYPEYPFLKNMLTPIPVDEKLFFNGQKLVDTDGNIILDLDDATNHLIRDKLKDRNGNIWIGSDFGIHLIALKNKSFKTVFNNDELIKAKGKSVRGITFTEHKIYVNLESEGFWEISRDNLEPKLVARYSPTGSSISYFGVYNDPVSGDIFSGGWESLCRYSPTTRKSTLFKFPKQVWAIQRIYSKDGGGNKLMIGCGGYPDQSGLYIFDEESGTIDPVSYNGFDELKTATILYIKTDKSGKIRICASSGLYDYDFQKGVTERYWVGGKGKQIIPAYNIQHFHEDADGSYWLATVNSGLIHWWPQTGKYEKITRLNGLSNNTVYAVYEDKHGYLWLPSDYGLMQFNKKSGIVKAWLADDGVAQNEFNRLAHCQTPDGRLFFGGLNGITVLDPDKFYDKKKATNIPFAISECTVFDQNGNKLVNKLPEIISFKTITMQPDESNLSLGFVLMDFGNGDQVRYSWMIEGYDKAWHFQKENNLHLGRLPYGEHMLRIRGQAADGQWSGHEFSITIKVLPPFYLKTWFVVLLTFVTAGLIWLGFIYRSRRLLANQERLEKEVEKATAEIARQADELRHTDQFKSRFFANVSHELRTPLTLILGPLSSMLQRQRLEDPELSYAKTAHQQGQQMLGLINEILDLSKIEAGKMELNESVVALKPFLGKIVGNFEGNAKGKGIHFHFNDGIAAGLNVKLDIDKCIKVFNNLLSNALKFTGKGENIIVTAEDAGSTIRISVADTGRGIHPSDLVKIFDRYYQGSQLNAPVEGGTGIGLALCRELVIIMHGSVRAESVQGKGSVFIFEFPKNEVSNLDPETVTLPESIEVNTTAQLADVKLSPGKKKQTVLVVEDNHSLQDFLKSILCEDYNVLTSSNGQEALEILQSENAKTLPDLIISDIMMPVMDGFQLLDALKKSEALKQIPVVMLTARADIEDKLRALRVGVDDYLIKPFDEMELMLRLKNLLRNADNRRIYREETNGMAAKSGNKKKQEQETQEQKLPSPDELAWLEMLEKAVKVSLGKFDFSIENLSEQMLLSSRHLQRRVQVLTGLTPNAYVKEVRLQEMRRLLEGGHVKSVKAAALSVGMSDVEYFSRQFKERFGKLPSAFIS